MDNGEEFWHVIGRECLADWNGIKTLDQNRTCSKCRWTL